MKKTLGERLGLPEELLSGRAYVELRSTRSAAVENQRGILEYGPEAISVAVREGRVRILGRELTIVRLTRSRVEVRGRIRAVELEE